MLTIIFGLPRVGKTAFMTAQAIDRMTFYAREDLRECEDIIEQFNLSGCNFSFEREHTTYSNYYINGRRTWYAEHKSLYVDGFKLGLPGYCKPTMFLPPVSQIYLDEGQRYFDSRKRDLPDHISRLFEIHGHNNMNITMTVQREKLIDLNIRGITGRFIEILDLRHKRDYNDRVCRSVWTYKEFTDTKDVERYVDSGEERGAEIHNYVFDGNIFQCYNSRACRPMFYYGKFDKNFDQAENVPTPYTVEDMKKFVENYSFAEPKWYRSKEEKK